MNKFFKEYHEKRDRLLREKQDTVSEWKSPVPTTDDILRAIEAQMTEDDINLFVKWFNCTDNTICMIILDKNVDFTLTEIWLKE